MSRMIGFRLDPDNPREAQALEVLRKGQEAGYSARHILTEALLALEAAAEDEQAAAAAVAEMAGRLAEIQALLERLGHPTPTPTQMERDPPEQASLAEAFVSSVKSAAKPGFHI